MVFGLADFGQLKRAAEIGPDAASVDEGPDAETGVDTVTGALAGRGPGFLFEIVEGDQAEQRHGC